MKHCIIIKYVIFFEKWTFLVSFCWNQLDIGTRSSTVTAIIHSKIVYSINVPFGSGTPIIYGSDPHVYNI